MSGRLFVAGCKIWQVQQELLHLNIYKEAPQEKINMKMYIKLLDELSYMHIL